MLQCKGNVQMVRGGGGRGFSREREHKGQRRGPMKGKKWVWRDRTSENSEVPASPSCLRPYQYNQEELLYTLAFFFFDCPGSSLWCLGLSSYDAQASLPHGMWDLSSPTRDQTCVPCIGRQILNH